MSTNFDNNRMLEELVEAGLEWKEARFYLAALAMDAPTVARVAQSAGTSRTNAYDLVKKLARRGLLSLAEGQGSGDAAVGRSGAILKAADPQHLLDEWHQRRRVLEGLVPQLRAIQSKAGTAPRSRYLEGASGLRTALFETLEWASPLRGILSMHDLLSVPGPAALRDYIDQRSERGLWLKVIRSPQKEKSPGWPTSAERLRETRYAPTAYVFTMTMIIGMDAVAMLSSSRENFALIIESAEYAEMHANLFEVLWSVSTAETD